MEAAPLTLAHTHARNAAFETRKSNPVAASEEHDLAAGEFATAAQNSSDPEALRTLRLLEYQHKTLAEILRFQHEHPASTTAETPKTSPSNAAAQPSATDPGSTKATSQDAQNQPPKLPGMPRMLSRESSSIASNLASARGIPSHPRRGSPVSPTLSAQQAGAKMTEGSRAKSGESRLREVPNKTRQSRASAPKQMWSPPMPSPTEIISHEVVPANAAENLPSKSRSSTNDEGFQRFYSTFEGLISKISAPLAFAGLPLLSEDPAKAASANRKSSAETKLDRHHATSDRSSSTAEPDVSRLFSRAALRSIRDTPGSAPGNPAESFYVVPTSGGTMSYAGILTRAEKEARRNSLDEADDEFVDAREAPASPEMRQSTGSSRSGRRGAPDKLISQNPKTVEELQMENQALKQLSDTLSKRLHMWEVNAQSSSMALQQSLRFMHHHNTGSPEQLAHGFSSAASPVAQMSTAPAMSDIDPKIKELEELAHRKQQDLDRIAQENEKLKTVLGRYRDRWEKLKEGAKTRRAEGRPADGQSSQRPDIPASPHPDTDSSNQAAGRNASGSDTGGNADAAP
ncbi:uncharacterized protein N7443_003692 [Penicillium atrosanguineum]|uniref:uncharacterized protein n=1 Tax=Penicillium atrosanguineum TaxID=1132637 RepID=UPI0023952B40|nr:uncharacterized protein N7443_003692 [Penicillium atrosanguineum]KAJ5304032.1 hypothetical protein N7443_003692 [Penicillium atrosanguineum]